MTVVTRHYVLAAGGTGGHLIPAFALAAELERRGHRVELVTDRRGAAIPGKPATLPAHTIPAGRLEGGNPIGWIKALIAINAGRSTARTLFLRFQPAAVIGFGGYPALPALLAAQSMGIPSIVHEQNAVLGRVNRFLAPRVNAIATAYARVDRLADKFAAKVHLIGNPVRSDVLKLREQPFPPVKPDGPLKILVTGGSQGARILSEIVPDGLALPPPALLARLQVTQQCRPEDIDAVRTRYAAHGIPAELGTYFEDMAQRLANAHLFIGRAGASTIAELTAVGRPAILIPLGIATDDHQTANAREMVAAGGALAIAQDRFTAAELAGQVIALTATLDEAAHSSWNCGYPRAAEDLADLVESFGSAPLMDVIRIAPQAEAFPKEQLA